MTVAAPATMRVVHLVPNLIHAVGTVERCIALARWQKLCGHDVTIVAHRVSLNIRRVLDADGISVVAAPGTTNLPAVPTDGEEFDVVHVHRTDGFGSSVRRKLCPRGGDSMSHTVHDAAPLEDATQLATPELSHQSSPILSAGKKWS